MSELILPAISVFKDRRKMKSKKMEKSRKWRARKLPHPIHIL